MMNKFQGPEDENFKLVSGSIKAMVQEAKRITLGQREGKTTVLVVDQYCSGPFSNGFDQFRCKHS